ncbi:hypothetical protein WJX74_009550 [Apatococcus lobatus]|uniref:Chitinase n=1 Tax=Apatococcus lobatus TaxID=904363 RepID=A0AAW1RZB6_9CHLO
MRLETFLWATSTLASLAALGSASGAEAPRESPSRADHGARKHAVADLSESVATTESSPFRRLLQNSSPSGTSGTCTYTVKPGDTLSDLAAARRTTPASIAATNGISDPTNIAVGKVLQLPCASGPSGQPAPVTGAPPTLSTAPGPSSGTCTYTVKPGDTLSDLAAARRTTPSSIAATNGISDPTNIAVGKVLQLPCASGPSGQPAPVTASGPAAPPLQKLVISAPTGSPVKTGQNGDQNLTAAAPSGAPAGNCQKYYRVQSGDTCWALRTKRLLSQQELLSLNPGLNCTNLKIDQQLCLPDSPQSSVNCTRFLEIQSGDTCWALAGNNRVTLDQFKQMNPRLDCASLQIGSPVCIRAPSIAPAANQTNYCSSMATTKPKDSCNSLAAQYSTTVARLAQINPGLDCSQSSVGASLSICTSAITAATKSDLTNYENPDRPKALIKLATACSPLNSNVGPLTAAYNANPSPGNEQALREQLSAVLATRPDGANLATKLESSDSDFKQMADQLLPVGANNTCSELRKSSDPSYAYAKDCFCNKQPGTGVMHCIAVLGEAMKSRDWAASESSAAGPPASRSGRKLHSSHSASFYQDSQAAGSEWPPAYALHGHDRRMLGLCGMNLPLNKDQLGWIGKFNPSCNVTIGGPPLCDVPTKPMNASQAFREALKTRTQATSWCLNIECCMELDPLSVCLGAGFCAPSMSFGFSADQRQICVLDVSGHPLTCATGKGVLGPDADAIDGLVSGSYLSADLKLCLLEAIVHKIPGAPEMCVHLLQLKYMYLKGMLDVGGQVDLWLVKFTATGHFKVTDAPAASWACQTSGLQCKDWCLMKNGDKYLTLKLEINYLFGTWEPDLKCGDACKQPSCPNPANSPLTRMVTYTTNWAQYRNISDAAAGVIRPASCQPYSQKPSHLNPSLYTHVVFAFLRVDARNYSVLDVEPNDKQQIQQMNDLKKGNGGLKTMISIGGWSFSRAEETFTGKGTDSIFPALASSNTNIKAFVDSAISYAKSSKVDGIDLDWEFPNFDGTRPSERKNFTTLIQQMHIATKANGLLFSIAVRPAKLSQHYEVDQLAGNTDFINLMSYDFHGAFDKGEPLGHNAPIMDCKNRTGSTGNGTQPSWDIAGAVQAYKEGGVPASQMNFGLATYGRSMTATGKLLPGDGTVSGPSPKGKCTVTDGSLAYYELEDLLKASNSQVQRDTTAAMAAWASYGSNNFVTFDDETTLRLKMCYARSSGFGGVFIWDGEQDDNEFLSGKIKEQYNKASCSDFAPPVCGDQ